jgi:hypothetical protein
VTPVKARLGLALMALAVGAIAGAAVPPSPITDLFGYYFFAGSAPAGFADIDHLHLSTIDEKNGEMVTVPLYGFLRMKPKGKALAVDHPLVDLSLVGKKLSFHTKPEGGLSYRFSGTFAKLGNFPESPPQGVILQGLLTKTQGGKKVAEAEVGFAYEAGD